MYQLHRVYCGAAWDLEAERHAFTDAVGDFNETIGIKAGILYVAVSLPGVPDKRPYQYAVDQNIRACRHYILAISEDWGPPARNFQREYQLALECSRDPALPMRETAVFVRQPLEGQVLPATFPAPSVFFHATADFKSLVIASLSSWFETLRDEQRGSAA